MAYRLDPDRSVGVAIVIGIPLVFWLVAIG